MQVRTLVAYIRPMHAQFRTNSCSRWQITRREFLYQLSSSSTKARSRSSGVRSKPDSVIVNATLRLRFAQSSYAACLQPVEPNGVVMEDVPLLGRRQERSGIDRVDRHRDELGQAACCSSRAHFQRSFARENPAVS